MCANIGGVGFGCGGCFCTRINVLHHDFGALVGEEPRCFCADTLSRAGNDGDLAREQTAGVVEVPRYLGDALESHCGY